MPKSFALLELSIVESLIFITTGLYGEKKIVFRYIRHIYKEWCHLKSW